MTAIPVLGSTLGQIFRPLYEAMAYTLAFFYAIIPNYAIAIALLTIVVMIVTAPLTVKSTKSTLAMQRLAPELKKLQQKYKGDRATLNEEMMKLYKEHGINPAGGCLPLLIQLPVFVVLYGVIRGLTNTVTINGHVVARPDYISKSTKLYHSLVASHGQMMAFGIDLSKNLFSPHSSWVQAIPYAVLVAIAIGLQYLQMRQLNSRNPAAAQANPQMQMMQKYMPLVFAIIYLRISAAVNIYFIVSSLCRIGIQETIFRSGILDRGPKREEVLPGGDGRPARRRTLMERLADAQQRAIEQQRARQAGLQPGTGASPAQRAKPGDGSKPPASKAGGSAKAQPGSQKPSAPRSGSPSKRPGGAKPGAGPSGGATQRNGVTGATEGPSGPRAGSNGGDSSANGSPRRTSPADGQTGSSKKRPRKAQ